MRAFSVSGELFVQGTRYNNN